MSVYWLQVTEPGHPSRVVSIDSRLEVGRDCEGLLVDDPTVSRRHLWLEPAPDGLVCVDMGSANGTFIDDARLEQPIALHAGNVIRLGETKLVVHEGHVTQTTEVAQPAIDPHERPSEGIRDLKNASSRNYVAKNPPSS